MKALSKATLTIGILLFANITLFAGDVSFKITKRYLNFPISHQQERGRMTFEADGKDKLSVVVRLAPDKADYWVFKDMSAYKGKTVKITYEGNEKGLSQIYQADEIAGQDSLYKEKNRPQFHFTTRRGWINDPNGLIYHDGEYHLFYQHNPFERDWENMHWGHAVSKDLVHWEELPDALYPDHLGTMFSGSAVIDYDNTAGFNKGKTPAMVAAFTAASPDRQVQGIAYSLDNGRTFTKYAHNPVIDSKEKWNSGDTRDPKVFWYAPESKWVMIVSADKEMRFYDSKNLKDWNYMSSFGEGYGVQPCQFECPDMVELPVDGDLNRKKWALIVNVNPGCYFGGSATQYFTGDFDGKKFSCDSQPNVTKWLDWGKDHYATVCFSNTGERTIAVPWMSNWQYCNIVPTKQFRSANALPRELSLYTQDNEIYLSAAPVPEIKTLRKEKKEIPAFTVANDYHIDSLLADNDGAYELALEITAGEAEIMGFSLFNDKGEKVDIYFNLPEKRLVMDRTKSGIVDFGKKSVSHEIEVHDRRKTTSINYIDDFALATWAPIKKENKYTLDVFVDKCSVEIFLNGGKVAMTNLIFPSEPYNRMCFYSKGGSFQVDSFNAYRLGL